MFVGWFVCSFVNMFWRRISWKRLEIEARFQRTTNEKWRMANRVVTCPTTSRDALRAGGIAYASRKSRPPTAFSMVISVEGGYVFTSVCLFVCPSDNWKSCERILIKLYGELGCGLETNWLHFGDDLRHPPDPGVRSRSRSGSGSGKNCRSAEVCALWVLLVVVFVTALHTVSRLCLAIHYIYIQAIKKDSSTPPNFR